MKPGTTYLPFTSTTVANGPATGSRVTALILPFSMTTLAFFRSRSGLMTCAFLISVFIDWNLLLLRPHRATCGKSASVSLSNGMRRVSFCERIGSFTGHATPMAGSFHCRPRSSFGSKNSLHL